MPSATDLVAQLARTAERNFGFAVAWHVALLAAALVVVFFGLPAKRFVATLSGLLVASVASFAFLEGNPFNAWTFTALAVALFVHSARLASEPIELASLPARITGAAMIAFGLFYPHFLGDRPLVAALYGAPVGVIPCPTLALVSGLALVSRGFGSRAIALLLVAYGLFYGLVGVARLGVAVDVLLVLGALALFGASRATRPFRPRALSPMR